MPLSTEADVLGRRLLVLTFALGHACDKGDNAEIAALFCERERVLLQLDKVEPTNDLLETLRQVQQAENLVLHGFHMAKAEAVKDLEKSFNGKRVAGAYMPRPNLQGFDHSR